MSALEAESVQDLGSGSIRSGGSNHEEGTSAGARLYILPSLPAGIGQ